MFENLIQFVNKLWSFVLFLSQSSFEICGKLDDEGSWRVIAIEGFEGACLIRACHVQQRIIRVARKI